MPETANVVEFGLQDVHVAEVTADTTATYTTGTPYAIPGAVKMSLDPKGDMIVFNADNQEYWTAPNNQGYDGTLEMARLLTKFAEDFLGETMDGTDNVLTETQGVTPKKFALMFQFEGDAKATRHVIYTCTAERPKIESSTKTDKVDVNTTSLKFSAVPRKKDRRVRAKTTELTTATIYDAWYTKVYGADTGA